MRGELLTSPMYAWVKADRCPLDETASVCERSENIFHSWSLTKCFPSGTWGGREKKTERDYLNEEPMHWHQSTGVQTILSHKSVNVLSLDLSSTVEHLVASFFLLSFVSYFLLSCVCTDGSILQLNSVFKLNFSLCLFTQPLYSLTYQCVRHSYYTQ